MVQFRKSKKLGPVRLTVSTRGVGISAGAGPLRVSRGADGKVRRTVRIPGTGIYDTKVISGSTTKRASSPPAKKTAPKKEYSSTTNGLCAIGFAAIIGIPSISSGFIIGIVIAAVLLLGGVGLLFDKSDSSTQGKPRVPTKAGWYEDPHSGEHQRYWTGSEWSSHTRVTPAGRRS
ncbi:MAG: DUF4236 domain-containing protein [Nocardiaceae bacterium]|nr:DUF4236 domain-containing protein [Nocardiaceae bacterium]